MNETVNQEQNVTADEQQEARTFTQAELNAIVSDRLARERAKYADYDELKANAAQFDDAEQAGRAELEEANARAAGLQKQLDDLTRANELRSIREKVAAQTGVPAKLLTGETEEDCLKQAAELREFRKISYPNVRDGGTDGSIGNIPGDWWRNDQALSKAFSRENKHTPKDKEKFYSY